MAFLGNELEARRSAPLWPFVIRQFTTGMIMLRIRRTSTLLLELTACLLLISGWAWGQAPVAPRTTGFLLKNYKDDLGRHKYAVFIPHAYTPAKKWPVILFLHGAGERGSDGVLPTHYGLGPLISLRQANFPFVVVFPQSEDMRGRLLKGWSLKTPDGQRALKILDQVEKDYSIDTKREILTGWSMGGYGAFEMAAAFPERWLSVVTVSGGGDKAWGEKLKDVPIWAWHGVKDKSVHVDQSQEMIAAVTAAGGHPRYSELADSDHEVWKQAYDDDALYAWMLSPRSDPAKLPKVTARLAAPAGQKPLAVPLPPFVPAVEMPRAAYVRLGNEMLAAVADSIPKIVPRDALIGRLNDITDVTESDGYTFNVYMSGLSYQAQVARASVTAYRKDRLNVQLALSNVMVTIGGTSLSGERHSAEAGPINIVIGHQRPVWLSFDVTPEVVNRQLRFRHVGTYFSIPNDNWYVTPPAGVSTHGFGMTRDKVSDGLVSGLYGRKATLEQQVAGAIPRLITELENKVNAATSGNAAAGVWPLPVYQPRLKVWPAEVSTDEKGVSLVLGVTAAAIETGKPFPKLKVTPPLGIAVAAVPQTTKLRAGLAPRMFAPLSEMLIDAGVQRIHVADTPSKEMAKFADAGVMAEAIPELKRFGSEAEVWSEIILAGPIDVVEIAGGRPALEAQKIKILVSIKTASNAEPKAIAEFDFMLKQAFTPKLVKPTSLTRAVLLDPDAAAEVEVKGGFVTGYEPEAAQIDLDRVKKLFTAGWDEFISGGGPPQADIHDIDLGYTKLRIDEAGWAAPELFAVFGPPGVKITNTSNKTLVYETKGPYSGWGGPYTLKPGSVHDFPITYPLLFRRQVGGTYQMFTLPVGTHSEFRTKAAGTPEYLYQAREPDEISKAVETLAAPGEAKK